MAEGVVAGIAIGVVGTVVGGLILAGILAAFRRMRRSGIRATYMRCELPEQASSFEFQKAVGEAADKENPPLVVFKQLVRSFNSVFPPGILSITLTNRGRVRSEAIEIIVPKLDLWHLREWNLPPSDRKLSIGSLHPHTTVVVTIVTNHDGRAIRIVEGVSGVKLRSDDLNDYSDYFGIGKFVLALGYLPLLSLCCSLSSFFCNGTSRLLKLFYNPNLGVSDVVLV